MSWIKFVTDRRHLQPTATLSKGILTFNRCAMQLIGDAEFIILFYDSDTGRIGLGNALPGETGRKRLRNATNGVGSISLVGMRDYFQIEEPRWFHVRPCEEHDIQIELSPINRPAGSKAGRKRR